MDSRDFCCAWGRKVAVAVLRSWRGAWRVHPFVVCQRTGKSTIANAVDARLTAAGIRSFVLDGDNLRSGLNSDLGFTPDDRAENIRRFGEVAKLFADAGIVALVAAISPYRADRAVARAAHRPGDFFEVFVSTPVGICEARDPKGLYQRARSGAIASFTGVSAPYEEPDAPELIVDAGRLSVPECVDAILVRVGIEASHTASSRL